METIITSIPLDIDTLMHMLLVNWKNNSHIENTSEIYKNFKVSTVRSIKSFCAQNPGVVQINSYEKKKKKISVPFVEKFWFYIIWQKVFQLFILQLEWNLVIYSHLKDGVTIASLVFEWKVVLSILP